jgi:hypothetical protein
MGLGNITFTVCLIYSMNRFLGYNLQNMTHQYLAFFLDLVLLCLLLIVLKPVALLLIYLELWVRIVFLSIIHSFKVSVDQILHSFFNLHVYMIYDKSARFHKYITGKSQAVKGDNNISDVLPRRQRSSSSNLRDYISCVFSFTMFFRLLTLSKRKKDDALLVKVSLLYRICRHVI